jgi:hypothetical protein
MIAVVMLAVYGCALAWDYSSSDVESVVLSLDLKAGEYDVFECDAKPAGVIKLKSSSQKIQFCVGQGIENRSGLLVIESSKKQSCFVRETGFCDESGVCESISLLDDCFDFNS